MSTFKELLVENSVLRHSVAELKEALDNSRQINYELKEKLGRRERYIASCDE